MHIYVYFYIIHYKTYMQDYILLYIFSTVKALTMFYTLR